jgi:hypothetical protein
MATSDRHRLAVTARLRQDESPTGYNCGDRPPTEPTHAKETPAMKTPVCLLILAASLAGCTQQSAENADTEKRIGLCLEVMKLYIVEAKVYERDRKKLVASCHISQKERTIEQWQCTLSAMQKGEKYESASDQCGRTAFDKP